MVVVCSTLGMKNKTAINPRFHSLRHSPKCWILLFAEWFIHLLGLLLFEAPSIPRQPVCSTEHSFPLLSPTKSRVVVAKESEGIAEGIRGGGKHSAQVEENSITRILPTIREMYDPTSYRLVPRVLWTFRVGTDGGRGRWNPRQILRPNGYRAMAAQFSWATIDFWLGTTAMNLRIWLEHGHKTTCRVPIFHLWTHPLSQYVHPESWSNLRGCIGERFFSIKVSANSEIRDSHRST